MSHEIQTRQARGSKSLAEWSGASYGSRTTASKSHVCEIFDRRLTPCCLFREWKQFMRKTQFVAKHCLIYVGCNANALQLFAAPSQWPQQNATGFWKQNWLHCFHLGIVQLLKLRGRQSAWKIWLSLRWWRKNKHFWKELQTKTQEFQLRSRSLITTKQNWLQTFANYS